MKKQILAPLVAISMLFFRHQNTQTYHNSPDDVTELIERQKNIKKERTQKNEKLCFAGAYIKLLGI